MATSKETRVRVDGRSKIMARTRPSSGRAPPLASAFMRRLSSKMPRRVAPESSDRSRKCRTAVAKIFGSLRGGARRQPGKPGVEAGDRLVDFHLADDQRRQQPDDVVA